MRDIKKEIEILELKIADNTLLIDAYWENLKSHLHSKKFISFAAFTSFAVGFFFARRKSLSGVIGALTKVLLTVGKVYRGVKMLLPANIV